MERRAAFKGLAALATVGFATPVAAKPVDPIITAIQAYKEGCEAYAAIPEYDWELHGGQEAVIHRTYGPPLNALQSWDAPAQTKQGALAALRMAESEIVYFDGGHFAPNLLDAAIRYFEAA